jgi:hypothetical protein
MLTAQAGSRTIFNQGEWMSRSSKQAERPKNLPPKSVDAKKAGKIKGGLRPDKKDRTQTEDDVYIGAR